jgi:hypothetical protein
MGLQSGALVRSEWKASRGMRPGGFALTERMSA